MVNAAKPEALQLHITSMQRCGKYTFYHMVQKGKMLHFRMFSFKMRKTYIYVKEVRKKICPNKRSTLRVVGC